MKRPIKAILAAVILALSLAAPVAAGEFEDILVTELREFTFRGDYPGALRLLRPLAEQGNAQAQASLGTFYYFGYGVPKDYVQAATRIVVLPRDSKARMRRSPAMS